MSEPYPDFALTAISYFPASSLMVTNHYSDNPITSLRDYFQIKNGALGMLLKRKYCTFIITVCLPGIEQTI